ncbi:nodulation receptor kinase-like isoform X5 [Daucus carota subsp. sativus]|uniref:nodulation receptor kinase-like isoform X5 n=1 Tax=Daucus carota subsp. sativus TaxID=79200 RepID=UPI0030837C3A
MLMPIVRFSLANRDFPILIISDSQSVSCRQPSLGLPRKCSFQVLKLLSGDPDKVTVVEALSVACVDFSAVGVARGLAFLHSSTEIGAPIVHRDFKSTNILLNDNYEAKISNFRLAKFMPDGHENCVTATVLGTFGYFDPEYKLDVENSRDYFKGRHA